MNQIIENCDSCHSKEACKLLLVQKNEFNDELMFLCNYCQTKKGFVIIHYDELLQAIIAEEMIIAKGLKRKRNKRLWGI